MNCEKIISQITAGLSGDNEEDIKYIQHQAALYKEHEDYREILQTCNQLIYERLPEKEKEEFSKTLKMEKLGIPSRLTEAREKMLQHDFDSAEEILTTLISRTEEINPYENDSVNEYHSFLNPLQELLYVAYGNVNPGVTLGNTATPLSEMYLMYGCLLVELERPEEAAGVLEKALLWNPADALIIFEYAEIFKMSNKPDKFLDLTKLAWKYAYEPKMVARCCRNAGYWFIEHGLWSEAAGYYLLSLEFEKENANAQNELQYIQSKAGEDFVPPELRQLKEYSVNYKIPFGPDNDLLSVLYTYGKHYYDNGWNEMAEYLLKTMYALAPYEEVGNMLKDISISSDTQKN